MGFITVILDEKPVGVVESDALAGVHHYRGYNIAFYSYKQARVWGRLFISPEAEWQTMPEDAPGELDPYMKTTYGIPGSFLCHCDCLVPNGLPEYLLEREFFLHLDFLRRFSSWPQALK